MKSVLKGTIVSLSILLVALHNDPMFVAVLTWLILF